ncbi:zinc finger and BTB domain-containing protein 49-like isoform X2 [Clinocottus analis]|uniref:zinc finger and BTB domain-containing protein 49-like isoform X2 n=1 Tax=Clinocottus analis TaxID=304258 RepID=UPI0035C0A5BF
MERTLLPSVVVRELAVSKQGTSSSGSWLHQGARGTSTEDVQLHSLIKEEQEEWSPSLDQDDPVRQHIKEEQEDFWTGPKIGSQLPGMQEEDVLVFQFTPVLVKSEEVEETSQLFPLYERQNEGDREAEPPASSSAEEIKTGANVEDCRGSEPDRVLEPGFKCLSGSADNTSQCSGAVTSPVDEDDRKKIRKLQTDISIMKKNVPVSDMGHSTGNKSYSCSKCGKRFSQKGHLQTHMRCHTGERPFICSLCGKRFTQKGNLTQHLTVHTREKPCSCPVCGEIFSQKGNLTQHMTVHTRENFVGERLTKSF